MALTLAALSLGCAAQSSDEEEAEDTEQATTYKASGSISYKGKECPVEVQEGGYVTADCYDDS